MSDERREQRERLKVDIDTRLAEAWALVWRSGVIEVLDEADDRLTDAFGAAMRAAYALGYRDALREAAEGRSGELARSNGYAKEGA